MEPPRRREVVLEGNRVVAPSVHLLSFRTAPGDILTFDPGQYITFFLTRAGKSVPRSYSFFSTAGSVDRFDLLIKQVPDGYGSTLLCSLEAGSQPVLPALAPLGRFLLRPPGGREVVFVATGTGVAPFLPMLTALRAQSPGTPTWLVFGERHREDLIGHDEFLAWTKAWPAFHFLPVLSRPPADGSWKGAVGHVQETVRDRFPDLSNAHVYLCGVPEMVNDTQALCAKLGCPNDQVFVERY